jgi:hypothetical protein
MARAAFNRKKILFSSKLYLILRKKQVKYYIWSTVLYGAKILILGKQIRNT